MISFPFSSRVGVMLVAYLSPIFRVMFPRSFRFMPSPGYKLVCMVTFFCSSRPAWEVGEMVASQDGVSSSTMAV